MGAIDLKRRGMMLVLSSPSGAGKTTLSRLLLDSQADLSMSVSVTTRPKRPGEIDGKDYIFVSQSEFDARLARGEFLEHARVFDHCYGTPAAEVEAKLANGEDVLFDIDWQGTQQLAESALDDLVRVFILPPSSHELERRLMARNQDSADVISHRMAKAADEMSHYFEYDWVIVNHDVEESVASVRSILRSERLKRKRQIGLGEFVKGLRAG